MSDKKNSKKINTNQNKTNPKSQTIPQPQTDTNEFENTKLELQGEIQKLKSQIHGQSLDIEDWKNKAIRISADLQNFQKQSELDQLQAKKIAKKSTILSLLPFLNTLNISFSFVPQTDDQKVTIFIETLRNSFHKLILELKNNNIEILTANIGDHFDPEYMDILNSDFANDGGEAKIKQVVSIGLKIDNQLIQPLSVIVE